MNNVVCDHKSICNKGIRTCFVPEISDITV